MAWLSSIALLLLLLAPLPSVASGPITQCQLCWPANITTITATAANITVVTVISARYGPASYACSMAWPRAVDPATFGSYYPLVAE